MEISKEIKENRIRFIHALKTNSLGLEQFYQSSLGNKEGTEVCPLGYACVLFGIDYWAEYENKDADYDPEVDGPYAKVESILGIDDQETRYIYRLNDGLELSFLAIGVVLENRWNLC